jgi:two-component system, NarL family, invasion response regulator UvrY
MEEIIKIALADDQRMLTNALATVINSFYNCKVLYTAANGKELIEKMTDTGLEPDVLILDLAMPVMDGFQTAQWLQLNKPGIKVLMLTMSDTDIALVRLLKFGVKGFVKKDADPKELRHAINDMVTVGYYYNTGIAGRLANLLAKDITDDARLIALSFSNQEKALLIHCCSELTFREISKDMKLTPSHVDNIRASLCTKIGVRTRVGLAMFAIRAGYVSV